MGKWQNFQSKLRDRKYLVERFICIITFHVDPLKLRRLPILFSIFCLWTSTHQNWGYLSKTGVGLNQQVTWFVVPYIVTAQVTLDKPTQACIMNARSDQGTSGSFHIILYCTVIVVHDGGKINRCCSGLADGGGACLQFVISSSLANPASSSLAKDWLTRQAQFPSGRPTCKCSHFFRWVDCKELTIDKSIINRKAKTQEPISEWPL